MYIYRCSCFGRVLDSICLHHTMRFMREREREREREGGREGEREREREREGREGRKKEQFTKETDTCTFDHSS